MGRTTVSTSSSTPGKLSKHAAQAKPPLKALKQWCLKKCSRTSSVGSNAPAQGPQVVATETIATPKPAWMRDGHLDPSIWKNLPNEVTEHILGFLPFPNLFRCATISKQLRAIAQSPHLRLTRAASAAAPWSSYCPVRYTHTDSDVLHWSGFSTATNEWQPLPSIPLASSTSKSVIAGAGGLLVLYKPGAIVVRNPVTGLGRELPQPNQKWSWPNVLHMISDDASGNYSIILAGSEAYSASKPQPTEIYHSATDKWLVTGSLPADLYLDTQDAALHNGLLYCTAQKAYMQAGVTLVGTDALVAYDTLRGVWSEVASNLPDESARQTPLVCGGRIVMAVAPVDDDGPMGCFYALNTVSRHWELVAAMPEHLHRRMRSWGVCVVSGNEIVVVSDTAQGCIVSYDVVLGTWLERKSPIKFSKASKGLLKEVRHLAPISFRPNVNAIPFFPQEL